MSSVLISNIFHCLCTPGNSLLRPSSHRWYSAETSDLLGIVFCRYYVRRWFLNGLPRWPLIASPSLANFVTSFCVSVAPTMPGTCSSPFLLKCNVHGSRALRIFELQFSSLCLAYRKCTLCSRREENSAFPLIHNFSIKLLIEPSTTLPLIYSDAIWCSTTK